MDPADSMNPDDLQEVRKIIEKSTSKVSLRDLEKKGFRKVKVLRSNDIDELIRRAVHAVVAREGMADSADNEELIRKSKEELRQLMAQTQASERERAELMEANERLETQIRELRAAAKARVDLEEKYKELQRRLADAEDARRRAEADAQSFDIGAAARAEELEQRARDAEAQAAAAQRRLAELERRQQDREREVETLRARLNEAEARALAYESRATTAEETNAKLARLREEAETLRAKLKQVETDHRLTQELEVPKLRERIEGLEADLRSARAAAAQAPAHAGMSDEKMRAMFRELLSEVGAGRTQGIDPTIKEEFAKMQRSIAESLARAGGRGRDEVTMADLDAAKISIAALFAHDQDFGKVQSNIDAVELKEKTTADSTVKANLNKLKSLRKGGSS